eukprot:TRINITY_DN68036_c0_g1_i1.p1 TRINITY_DN68036_c0_g1~~TRINITY_DN68036_c0_g1_i1.p1  ORF type:complete len:367 (+),score=35.44 TRINITY_DN68036_c0_g1_i1:99-1199(+)
MATSPCFVWLFAWLCVTTRGAQDDVLNYDSYTFESYLVEFGKNHPSELKAMRREAFEGNLADIRRQNEKYASGQSSWFAGVNNFTDWTKEEFLQALNMPRSHLRNLQPLLKRTANPESVDWRQKGAVTAVRNQQCGDCWANAAVETVESHYQIASGKLLNLSAQAYVNCVKNPQQCGGQGGCKGATFELAYNLTVSQGVPTLDTLPYGGGEAECKPYKAAVRATGYVDLPPNDGDALETALATKGPIAVTVAADAWMTYRGGIMDTCAYGLLRPLLGLTLNHGVQAVGYTKEYWIVRNSWGPGWGVAGYIHLTRAHDQITWKDFHTADGVACKPYPKSQIVGGECGVLAASAYPTGVSQVDAEVMV